MSAVSGKDLVASVEGDVERLKVVSRNSSAVLSDDIREVRQLCSDLEAVLRHQQKERSSFWGDRRDYYHYLTEQLSNLKDLEVVAKRILGFPQLTTHQGKGRALLRLCLSEGKLADCIQNAVNNEKLTREWYSSGSVLRLPSLSSRLLNALYDLSDLTFDLPCDEVDLNETWPTFQRKQFGSQPSSKPLASQTPSGIQAILVKTQEAVPDTMNRSVKRQVSSEKVEHAIEEEPSEIYVKEELTLDIPFAVQVMKDILACLEQIGPTSLTPEQLTNQIAKWEDLPCGLLELRNCIRGWTSGVSHQLRMKEMRLKDVELQLAETMEQCESDDTALAMQVQEMEAELQRARGSTSDLQKEVAQLLSCNQCLEKDITGWRQNVESLENTNFDLQERLVAIGSLVEAVRSEISDYCPHSEEIIGEGEKEVEEEANVDFRLQGNAIEGRLQLVVTGCSRIAEDLATLQHERDELQMSLEASFKQADPGTEQPSLQLQLSEAKKTAMHLQEDNSRLTEKVQELGRLVKSKDAELRRAEARLVAGATRERATVHSPLDQEGGQTEVERQLSDAAEELKRVQEQLSTLNQLVHKTEKEKEELEARLMQKEREEKELEARLVKKEKEREGLEACLVEKEREGKELEAHLVEKEREGNEIKAHLVEKEREGKELESRLVEKEREGEELEARLVEKENDMQRLQRECSAAREELQSMQGVVDQETSSLHYEVSSLAMEREQALKSCRVLEEEVDQLKGKMADSMQERCALVEQVKGLQKELGDSQGEVGTLQEQLMDITALRDRERADLLKMKNEIDGANEQSSAEKRDLVAKVSQLKVENGELRKAFKGLLTQKASLWEHASSLEDKVNSTWQDQKGVLSCAGCGSAFTMLNRKHHCRSCGVVFCRQCCSNRILTAASRDPVRVCKTCYGHRNEVVKATQLANELEQSLMLASNNFGMPSDGSLSYTSYLNPPPSTDNDSLSNGEYSVTPLGDGGAEILDRDVVDGLPYVVKSVADGSGGDGSGEGYCIIETSSEASTTDMQGEGKEVATSEQAVGGEHKAVFPSGPPQAQVLGPLDLDVLREKLALLEVEEKEVSRDSPSTPQSKGSPTKDSKTQEDKVSLRAGQCHEVELKIEKPGVLLEWEFRSEPKGIAFGMFYRQKDGSLRSEVLPSRRCTSHKTTLTGKIVTQKPGTYILNFDNGFSKYSACTLNYKISTRNAP